MPEQPTIYADCLKARSERCLQDAKTLMAAESYCSAYHMAGLCVECALKACIARKTSESQFPDKKIANKAFVHDPFKLVEVAHLKQKLNHRKRDCDEFTRNWMVVKDWTIESRYFERTYDRQMAEALIDAIEDGQNGILPWIKEQW